MTRLTEEQLDSIMQWACSSDLRQRDGEELQNLVDEVRDLRKTTAEHEASIRNLIENNARLTKAINEMPEWERAVKATATQERADLRAALLEACGIALRLIGGSGGPGIPAWDRIQELRKVGVDE